MEKKVQQHVCIDFCFCLGKTGAETYEMLQAAFGESCLSRSKTFEWYSCFQNGRRSFEDDPRPGRPSTSHTEETVARVREIVRADRRLTIREVAEDVGIAYEINCVICYRCGLITISWNKIFLYEEVAYCVQINLCCKNICWQLKYF
jgi:hypothetical protein